MSATAPAGSPRRLQRASGFAVVITLALLSLLVALLLTMAALTRVETRNSDRALRQTQARRNACMALSIAVGRLQKFAGPDARVTATAEAFGGSNGSRYFTGVWDAAEAGAVPLTWLVSGNEGISPLAITPSDHVDAAELVGMHSSGIAGDVLAPRQPILASDPLGNGTSGVVGHFAWWVGDENVKADVALADRSPAVSYAPFDSAELRQRIRQQLAHGAGPADAAGEPVFEPDDAANAPLAPKMITAAQLAFLHRSGDGSAVGLELGREHWHDWTVGNYGVLAMTRPGGLKQDLSLQPELLGSAYAAWADYARYMEDPAAPLAPSIAPAYPLGNPRDALRRRYRLTAPTADSGIAHGVAPVLSYFLLTFNVRTDQSVSGSTRPLEVRARWLVSLWNPCTSALVPEDLQLEVSGLPVVQVLNDTMGATVAEINLDALYGAPLRISLPWEPGGRADQQSWLPGRVYTWASEENLDKSSPPPATGFASLFYTRNLSSTAGQGVQRPVAGTSMANAAQAHLQGNPSQLTVRLYHGSASGNRELLRTQVSPAFEAFAATPTAASAATYQFSLVFHLMESADNPLTPDLWLTTPGQDPREAVVPAGSYQPGANGPRPELYPNYTAISFPDRLLDRALPATSASTTGQSYNEDTPLFELPRGPVLSVGGLQQLALPGARPFAIGNPWGHAGRWNQLFDRYFFSGLDSANGLPDLAAGESLPNSLLRLAPRQWDEPPLTAADLIADSGGGYSSKHLLQAGAFNLNSVNPAAWLAVLRAGRFSAGNEFNYLAATASTGTQADSPTVSVPADGAVFWRFPWSAQETYQADAGYAASTTVPPTAPNSASAANTHLFRRGVRRLTPEQTTVLAGTIAALLRQKQASSGPYRSLEEFLNPSDEFDGSSLLETAISEAVTSEGKHLNDPGDVPEFSSQWLTQGDMASLLAPVLLVRSDTFIIRAYGDTANPATGEIESRAWCEARVQRLPEYCDATQPADTPPSSLNATNQAYGRRFRIIQFRWLTSSDI